MTKVTIHMVSSLDGFIASKDGSVSWMETVDTYENGVSEENAEDFLKSIDCFVLGSRTYELALQLGWPYGEVPTLVLTHRNLPNDRKNVVFHSGDLNDFFKSQLKPNYQNVWLVGGASLARDFMRLKLADEIRLTLLPIILGDGLPLFDRCQLEKALHLKNVSAYNNGTVELWYEILD